MKATDFVATYGPKGPGAWEAAALSLAAQGGLAPLPFFPVPVSIPDHKGVFFAAFDYVTIGELGDYMHIPLTPGSAQKLADMTSTSLPTPRMVAAIWKAAPTKLAPQPIAPYPPNTLASYLQHSRTIDEQIGALPPFSPNPFHGLIAGHKKDVVLTNQLIGHNNVAIYGWQKLQSGTPIQGLNAADPPRGHAANFADYSHGIRLIWPKMIVDGQAMELAKVFADPVLSALVSSEGPLRFVRYPTTGPLPGLIALQAPDENEAFAAVPASFTTPGGSSPPPDAASLSAPSETKSGGLFALGFFGFLALVFSRMRK